MNTKFSEDIVPISDLKVNPGKIVKQVQEAHRPVVLTSRGLRVAVVQSLRDYEAGIEQGAFMKAVVKGMTDLEEGQEVTFPIRPHICNCYSRIFIRLPQESCMRSV